MTAIGTVSFAFGTTDITPQNALPLAPVIGRTGVFQKVADRLEANICVARWCDREQILVSADLLFIGEIVRATVEEQIGLKEHPQNLLLAATHTHSAPMTQPGMPILAPVNEGYAHFVAGRISQAVRSLRTEGYSCNLTWSSGMTTHSLHRRLKRLRLTKTGLRYSAEIGPEPRGPRDEAVRVLKFTDSSGKICAILWNYACHPTDFPYRDQVSADFPGMVRQRLRDVYGAIPVLYFQGFSGDVRPPFRRRLRSLKSVAYRALWGPEFGTPSEPEWNSWADSLAEKVSTIVAMPGTAVHCDQLSAVRHLMPLAEITNGEDSKQLTLQAIRLGPVTIVGLSAEAVTRYRAMVEQVLGEPALVTINCLDQNHGYLPAESMLRDRGYEVEGFRHRFNFSGRYKAGMEARLTQELTLLRGSLEMARPTGTKSALPNSIQP